MKIFLLIEMKIKNVNEERISHIDTDVELNVNMKSETFIWKMMSIWNMQYVSKFEAQIIKDLNGTKTELKKMCCLYKKKCEPKK